MNEATLKIVLTCADTSESKIKRVSFSRTMPKRLATAAAERLLENPTSRNVLWQACDLIRYFDFSHRGVEVRVSRAERIRHWVNKFLDPDSIIICSADYHILEYASVERRGKTIVGPYESLNPAHELIVSYEREIQRLSELSVAGVRKRLRELAEERDRLLWIPIQELVVRQVDELGVQTASFEPFRQLGRQIPEMYQRLIEQERA